MVAPLLLLQSIVITVSVRYMYVALDAFLLKINCLIFVAMHRKCEQTAMTVCYTVIRRRAMSVANVFDCAH